jgi:hypothetical protein
VDGAKQFVGKMLAELADIIVWVEEKFDKSITEEAAHNMLTDATAVRYLGRVPVTCPVAVGDILCVLLRLPRLSPTSRL